MELQKRLEIFLERLKNAPPCQSADEALSLISRVLEEIEAEFCPHPREEPPPMRFTGRMYAPRVDRVERTSEGLLVASSRHHRIYCHPDGAFRIVHVPSRQTVIHKTGSPS
jgi:hypothetical protein